MWVVHVGVSVARVKWVCTHVSKEEGECCVACDELSSNLYVHYACVPGRERTYLLK